MNNELMAATFMHVFEQIVYLFIYLFMRFNSKCKALLICHALLIGHFLLEQSKFSLKFGFYANNCYR